MKDESKFPLRVLTSLTAGLPRCCRQAAGKICCELDSCGAAGLGGNRRDLQALCRRPPAVTVSVTDDLPPWHAAIRQPPGGNVHFESFSIVGWLMSALARDRAEADREAPNLLS